MTRMVFVPAHGLGYLTRAEANRLADSIRVALRDEAEEYQRRSDNAAACRGEYPEDPQQAEMDRWMDGEMG